ncbi:MAG: hypothetical protein K0S74_806 [Chlamydiales bacterium]|jgi:predicted KAP-like P-loop ATPase|nr:hypothetical protein [Chlamydiales bacterium]
MSDTKQTAVVLTDSLLEKSPISQVSLQADIPIELPEQDQLNRFPFAQDLAACIKNWDSEENLVIALCGPWGIGKTSLKNLTVSLLKQEDAYEIVEFNPSELYSQDAIVVEFFKTLLNACIKQTQPSFIHKFTRYATRATGTLKQIDTPPTKWFYNILKILMAPFKKTENSIWAIQPSSAEENLATLKGQILKEMDKLQKPILFVIDDIDRLTKEEAKLVFSLVKSNAEFPKLVYLLLFDYNRCAEALKDTDQAQEGEHFLSKIIQVFLDVPPIDPQQLKEKFQIYLDLVVYKLSLDVATSDKERLEKAIPDILHFIHSMRELKRFFNSLKFQLSLTATINQKKQIHLLPKVVLEVIRVFQNKVYRSLVQDVDLKQKEGQEELQVLYDLEKAIEQASENDRDYVKRLLEAAFKGYESKTVS